MHWRLNPVFTFFGGGDVRYYGVHERFYSGFDSGGLGINLGYNFLATSEIQLGPEIEGGYFFPFGLYASFLLRGTVSLSKRWDLIAKAGVGRIGGIFFSSVGYCPILSIGLAYNLNDHRGLGLQYSYMFGNERGVLLDFGNRASFSFNTVMLAVTHYF